MSICSRRGVQQKLTIQTAAVLLVLLAVYLAIPAFGQQTTPPPNDTPLQTLPPLSGAPPSSASQSETPGSAPLRVLVGKSLLINTNGDRIRRISVTDSAVADAIPISPTQILVHGRSPGEVSLLIWDESERSRSFDLRVDVDVTACQEEIKRIFPDEQIDVSASRSAIVLSGHVTTEDVAKHAGQVASAYSKNVINVLTFGPVGAQEVLLEVKFAEVDRAAVTQLGVNLFAPGLGNTIALGQTGQFGTLTVNTAAQTTTTTGNTTTTTTTATAPVLNVSDFLNLFIARTDVPIGAVIKALQQKNLLQI